MATGSPEGRAAADSSLTSALDEIEELRPEPSTEVTAAIDVLRDVSFEDPDAASAPSTEDSDAAVTTLSESLGTSCGDLGR